MTMRNWHVYFVFLISAFLVLSCARRNFPEQVDVGQRFLLSEGVPDFVISAGSFFDDDGNSTINVNAEISKASLIYASDDEGYNARIKVIYEIYREPGNGNQATNLHKRLFREITIPGDPDRFNQGFQRMQLIEEVTAEPGYYRVVVQVTDAASDKYQVRETHVQIPDLNSRNVGLTSISVTGINRDGSRRAISTYDVPSNTDSLSFRFFLTRPDGTADLFVRMQLLQFESDLDPARAVSLSNLPPGTIQGRGIHYGRSEVVEQQVRRLDTVFGAVEMIFTVPMPESGSYRFEVFLTGRETDGPDRALSYIARDFGTRSPNFPEIATTLELAEPLVYLMSGSEHRELMEIADTNEMRRAIEEFWLENLGSSSLAREVMAAYYERVVEANKRFSGIKEGWKTDFGLIFIIFGNPWYVDHFGETITWVYGYDKYDPNRTFTFNRTRIGTERFPFHTWSLVRREHYHSVYYQRRQEWLNGYVLNRTFPF